MKSVCRRTNRKPAVTTTVTLLPPCVPTPRVPLVRPVVSTWWSTSSSSSTSSTSSMSRLTSSLLMWRRLPPPEYPTEPQVDQEPLQGQWGEPATWRGGGGPCPTRGWSPGRRHHHHHYRRHQAYYLLVLTLAWAVPARLETMILVVGFGEDGYWLSEPKEKASAEALNHIPTESSPFHAT